MSIVIVSSSAAGSPDFRKLRSIPVPPVAAPASTSLGAASAQPGAHAVQYWAIPAVPDSDEGFLYSPVTAGVQTARPVAEVADSSAWAPFDGVTLDEIASATPTSAARLFSYSLW